MKRLALVCAALSFATACRQVFGLDGPVLAIDAAEDGPASPDAAANCVGSGAIVYCAPAEMIPMTDFTIGVGMSTTLSGASAECTRAVVGGVDACVIAARTVTIAGGLRATGQLPLVIAAFGDVDIAGTLDVSSPSTDMGGGFGGAGGAGFGVGGNCPTLNGVMSATTGGSGGGGGGLGTAGGAGGKATDTVPGGAAGSPLDPAGLHGGCAGGIGASATSGGQPGAGGRGGGVVYVLAKGTITVTGTINASGGGGGGGGKLAGGGGGGSGGMIGFDASSVTLGTMSKIFANGGGGGEGGDNNVTGDGGSVSTSPMTAAPGGSIGSQKGGNGGNGSVGDTAGGTGSSPNDPSAGGGGGGGGGGIIVIHAQAQAIGGSVSPTPH